MNVKIVDCICGGGKTSAAINMINQSRMAERYLYITPFLEEVTRIKTSCASKNFHEPSNIGGKLNGIKCLLKKGKNIVSTHALFHLFDDEIMSLCLSQRYNLIMDEVTTVIEKYRKTNPVKKKRKIPLSKNDLDLMLDNKLVRINSDTGLLEWIDKSYKGTFDEIKDLCMLNSLAVYAGTSVLWLFPTKIFQSFKSTYILTYMFNAQPQRYYYDYWGIKYEYLFIKRDEQNNFIFSNEKNNVNSSYDYKKLIHIYSNKKLNSIGDSQHDLSLNWYKRNFENPIMKKLKNNTLNYFRNIMKSKSANNIWTTYKDYQELLSGNGYAKGFLSISVRATNQYSNKTRIAYLVNRFLDGGIKNFFIQHGVQVDEDGYALSEMLQFIWRSAIRDGKEIWIYIPSSRMRSLLTKWIDDNSPSIQEGEITT